MGSNEWGQLGINPFNDMNSTFISKLEELKLVCVGNSKFVVDQVSCGSAHSLLLI